MESRDEAKAFLLHKPTTAVVMRWVNTDCEVPAIRYDFFLELREPARELGRVTKSSNR